MGRLSGTKPQSGADGGGRISVKGDNPNVQQIAVAKTFDEMNFGEKFFATLKQVPKTLGGFLPPSTRELLGKAAGGEKISVPEFAEKTGRGGVELAQGIAQVISTAVGGAVLSMGETLGLKKGTNIPIPYIGEIGSYASQTKDLTEQGFSDSESKALVAINAYLGLVPFAVKAAKTTPGQRAFKAATTKEISAAEALEGIRAQVSGKPAPTGTARVERLAVTKVKETFGKTETQQKFNKLMEENLDKFHEGRDLILAREDPLNQALIKLSKEELDTYANYTQGIVTVEKPSPKLRQALELWRDTNRAIEADQVGRGKLTPLQIEARRWKPVEMITGRSAAELKKMGVEPTYYPYLAEARLSRSDFILPKGRRTKGGYLKRWTGKLLYEDKYIKDPTVAIPRHRIQIFRDQMNAELINAVRDTFAEKSKPLIAEFKKNPELAERLGYQEWKPAGNLRFFPTKTAKGAKGVGVTKRVESHWVPKEVAKSLDKIYRPSAIEKILRMTYDPVIDMWRVSVLNLVPRWLYNNVVGNTVLSILAKTDPLAFGKATKELFARTKTGERLGVAQRDLSKGVLLKEFAPGESPKIGKLGSLPTETTQFLRPIENWLNLLEQAKNYRALRIPAIATQGLIRGWVAIGKPIGHLNKVAENWFRAAVYISKTEGKFLGARLEKPVPPAEGLSYVNEFLFDYTKLSRIERATFRRALPFYNWMKNITEFSLKLPAKHPVRGLVAGALLQDYVDWVNETNQAEDKVKSVLRLKTDLEQDGRPMYLSVRSAIPFSDVFVTLPVTGKAFLRFMTSNPVSKIIFERIWGINAYTGQPFTTAPGKTEINSFGKEELPRPSLAEHVGKNFPQVQLIRSAVDALRYGAGLKRYETGEPKVFRGKVQVEDWMLPILRYFGINMSAYEINDIERSVKRKEADIDREKKRYQKQLERSLNRLEENQ